MKKKLLALLVCIISVMCMCVVSASAAGGSATFSDGKTLTWAQLKSSSNGTAYGYDASKITDTSIGEKAFYNNGYGCTKLVSIIIPDGVTSIGAYAFDVCTNLTSITIPNSVTSIRDHAFYICKGLTSITIPDSVTSIEAYAFRYRASRNRLGSVAKLEKL